MDVWTKFEEGRSRRSEVIFSTFGPGDLDLSPSDIKINGAPQIPRADVWTKFEESMSRSSRVIDRKQKGYRRTDRPTDMCKAICPLFFKKGGIKNEAKQKTKATSFQQVNKPINAYTITGKVSL